jgi:hypothetical protein
MRGASQADASCSTCLVAVLLNAFDVEGSPTRLNRADIAWLAATLQCERRHADSIERCHGRQRAGGGERQCAGGFVPLVRATGSAIGLFCGM